MKDNNSIAFLHTTFYENNKSVLIIQRTFCWYIFNIDQKESSIPNNIAKMGCGIQKNKKNNNKKTTRPNKPVLKN